MFLRCIGKRFKIRDSDLKAQTVCHMNDEKSQDITWKSRLDGQLYCEKHDRSSMEVKLAVEGGEDEEKNKEKFFESIARIQSSRLNDQRCEMPKTNSNKNLNGIHGTRPNYQKKKEKEIDQNKPIRILSKRNTNDELYLQKMYTTQKPYPLIILPDKGGYWIEEISDESISVSSNKSRFQLELDETAIVYRKNFYEKEHFNFYAVDEKYGEIILSVRRTKDNKANGIITCGKCIHFIIRTSQMTIYKEFVDDSSLYTANLLQLTKEVLPDIFPESLQITPILYQASDEIATFDEHIELKNYKIGIVYQKSGQTKEEELFSNTQHSIEFDTFLNLIGSRVKLKDFDGYRGGLDTLNSYTGSESLYTVYEDRRIMFHVSTLLPTDIDPQQLQRKRHIGNDIVAVIFQEENGIFIPSLIASNFLHAFVIVQPAGKNMYRLAVTARSDVPKFKPYMTTSTNLISAENLREFLLTKLLNAENACYKAEIFSKLGQRTRSELFKTLYKQIREKNEKEMLLYNLTTGFHSSSSINDTISPNSNSIENNHKDGLFSSFKRAFSSSKRSQSVDSNLALASSTSDLHKKKNKSTTSFVTPSLATVGETTPLKRVNNSMIQLTDDNSNNQMLFTNKPLNNSSLTISSVSSYKTACSSNSSNDNDEYEAHLSTFNIKPHRYEISTNSVNSNNSMNSESFLLEPSAFCEN